MVAFLKVIQIDPTIEQPYIFLGRMLDQAGRILARLQTRTRPGPREILQRQGTTCFGEGIARERCAKRKS